MSLHFEICVNREPIGTVVINRLAARDVEDPDDVLTYAYRVAATLNGTPSTALFTHRYSDGALVCIRKALQAIEAGAST